MTDEKIIELAEKTKKEKYCKRYLRDSTEKPFLCDIDCPFTYEGFNCEDEYETAFLNGFKAAMEYINQIPHFRSRPDIDTEIIEKFRDNPELCNTYLSEMEKNIQCIINGILSRE